MLEDLSAHILDVAQNSSAAGASCAEIIIRVDEDFIALEISDDGDGMDAAAAGLADNPFYTSRLVRRVGLGLPFLKQSAELCGGKFELSSSPGKGTRVFASFAHRSVDTPPVGDLAGTFLALMIDAPSVRWLFRCERAGETVMDLDLTALAAAALGQEPLRTPAAALKFKAAAENEISALSCVTEFRKKIFHELTELCADTA